MRTLFRNKRKIEYALYLRKEETKDSSGDYTGEWKKIYAQPVTAKLNVSESRNYATNEPYGSDTHYTRIMVTTDKDCPIDLHTLLWIGISSHTQGSQTVNVAPNYVVIEKSDTVNGISYVIKEANNGIPDFSTT